MRRGSLCLLLLLLTACTHLPGREARLYDDLDLDSIDAVDMVVHLQKKTGHKIKPDTFKAVRTVQDVVDVVEQLQREA